MEGRKKEGRGFNPCFRGCRSGTPSKFSQLGQISPEACASESVLFLIQNYCFVYKLKNSHTDVPVTAIDTMSPAACPLRKVTCSNDLKNLPDNLPGAFKVLL